MDKWTLKQYQKLLKEIEHLEAEKKRVLDSYLAPPQPTGMPASHAVSDRVMEVAARRLRYQDIIDGKLDELVALREKIEDAISGLDPADRDLLRMRYIDGRRWEWIAVELNYDYRYLLKKHGRVLEKIKGE